MIPYKSIPISHQIAPGQTWLFVSIGKQTITLLAGGAEKNTWPVSTSRFGAGNREGSLQTPLGWHCVGERIGDGQPLYTIFKGRVAIPNSFCRVNDTASSEDIISTRIVWLRGLEPGVNSGEGIDSFARYIYIHGTHDEKNIGIPQSIGCVRMKNNAMLELFSQTYDDMPVLIGR